MLEHFDHDELLAYIEGELPPDEAARLEHELANSPRAAMQVERLRRDRELLRTDREPAMPRNFLPKIESRLARPMLMETLREAEEAGAREAFAGAPAVKPGAMRRQHRRATLRRRLTKFSVAAMLVLAIGAGIWTAVTATNLTERASDWVAAWQTADESEVISNERDAALGRETDDEPVVWPPGAIVHHAPSTGATWTDYDRARMRDEAAAARAMDTAPPLDVLLIIRADDPSAFESSLTQLVQSLDAPAALVQNFSYDEAARLAEAWSREQAGRPDRRASRPPMTAETRSSTPHTDESLSRLADDARQQLRRSGGERSLDAVDQSRRLVGSRELAATFAKQLEYSSRGATHTITMPAGRLHDLLAALNRAADGRIMLSRLSDSAAASEADAHTAQEAWLTHRRDLQRLLMPLERIADDALIHLPVRVERAPIR